MFSVDWLCFEKIIELMETKFNGYMTFKEAVFFTGLPRHYRGNTYIPNFLKNKILASGQKRRERIGYTFPKHPKTSKTDKNSRSYP